MALRLCARARARSTCTTRRSTGADALVDLAERHAGDLAADYTYLQPAQPTTIGHLLLAYAAPALRDAERLRAVHGRLDLSVAGAGGSAGSRWPLDRARLADLLGCSGVVPHTKDAMWQADVYVELAAAVAIAATHGSQLGQDLEILASQEFAAVDPGRPPQPRERPDAAEAQPLRARRHPHPGGHRGGRAGGDPRDPPHRLGPDRPLPPAQRQRPAAAGGLGRGGAPRRPRWSRGSRCTPSAFARAAREGFTAAADVADVLAQEAGLDYRTAHQVVGRAVRDLVDDGPVARRPHRRAARPRPARRPPGGRWRSPPTPWRRRSTPPRRRRRAPSRARRRRRGGGDDRRRPPGDRRGAARSARRRGRRAAVAREALLEQARALAGRPG